MSHVVSVDVKFRDLETLKRAFLRMGGTWKENQKTFAWYGSWLSDYHATDAAYRVMDPKTFGKCDHAVSFPNAAYEVGIVQEGDEYRVVWDFWGPGGLVPHMGTTETTKLKQFYSVEAVKLTAERQGQFYDWTETFQDNGTIVLEARGY